MPEQSLSDPLDIVSAIDALDELTVAIERGSRVVAESVGRLTEAVDDLNHTLQVQWAPAEFNERPDDAVPY